MENYVTFQLSQVTSRDESHPKNVNWRARWRFPRDKVWFDFTLFLDLKAYVSEEILNRHCLSLSLSADLCIHFYWLSQLRQASHREMIQRLRLWLCHFKITSDNQAFKPRPCWIAADYDSASVNWKAENFDNVHFMFKGMKSQYSISTNHKTVD